MTEALIGELLSYCRAHPVEKVDAERFLRHLADIPQALVDMRTKGWVGIILNRAKDPGGAAPFEWIAATRSPLGSKVAEEALRIIARRARALGLPGVHVLKTACWAEADEALKTAGAAPLYHDWDMSNPAGDWGDDMPIPDGWKWVSFTEPLGPAYVALLRASFGALPGFYMPADEEVLRGLRETASGARVLMDPEGRMRALMRCRIERRYIHAIARDPECRGMGLGRLAMDEARRVLGPGPIALSTVKENAPAATLYQRLGFKTDSEIATWSLPVP